MHRCSSPLGSSPGPPGSALTRCWGLFCFRRDMIHGDSGREGGIGRSNGTRHVSGLCCFARSGTHPTFKRRPVPAGPIKTQEKWERRKVDDVRSPPAAVCVAASQTLLSPKTCPICAPPLPPLHAHRTHTQNTHRTTPCSVRFAFECRVTQPSPLLSSLSPQLMFLTQL